MSYWRRQSLWSSRLVAILPSSFLDRGRNGNKVCLGKWKCKQKLTYSISLEVALTEERASWEGVGEECVLHIDGHIKTLLDFFWLLLLKIHSRSDVSLHCTLTCTHPYFHSVTQAPEFYIGGEDWQVHGYNFSVGRCQWFGCFAHRTGSGREDTKDTMFSLKLKKQATVLVIWGTLWGLTSESVPHGFFSMFILTSCHREQKKSSWMGHVWFSCPLESICFPGLTNAPGEIKVW